jgi:hypothetical protein
MKSALLGAAAIVAAPFALASPASAQSFVAASITASSGVRDAGFAATHSAYGVHVHRGAGAYSSNDGDSFRRGHRRYDRNYAFGYAPGYYDPGDYDANRSFDPDKWNDWWHERPERAFPRWVWRNRDCTEDRMWWSGAGWRCTP